MVDNVGIAVGIVAPSLAVQKLFPLPVLLAAILNFGSLPLLTNVNQRQPMSSCQVKVGNGRKFGGSRWNRVAI